jgi:predicted nuclease with RNAse H fold/dephospho-CoA kinase
MLPFHDVPADPAKAARLLQRSARPPRQSARGLGMRVAPALADPSRLIFLDVETGLSWYYDELTIVGWACGGTYQTHIVGHDPDQLLNALALAKALVTFNGTLFDLRFLKKTFGELALPPIHIDLRYLAKRVGLTGGQKAIERILCLPERVGLEDVDGAAAVILWHRYLRGDKQSLTRLIDYNRRDVIGMCGILDEDVDRLDLHPDLLFCRLRFNELASAMRAQAIEVAGPAFSTRVGSLSTFEKLFGGSPAKDSTVIGIDLTGSESRPSGWCVMHRNEAETRTVSSDEEIVCRVLAERPAVVSIDSPLSMPFGRVRVEDSDPGREKFGIMRNCERELKRRGINVYPCLLPSMQGLTRRGIRLAHRLRSAGVPVIECYPGAAQDIMGIPRKGAGIEFLKQGLVDFGIRGSFIDSTVTHDELDAITSAIVGSFFLSGRFEALRGPSEDALIIPDLRSDGRHGMVIGISGRICAGKTTTARILEKRGFAYTRFSLVIDDEIVTRGEAPGRAARQRVGTEINRTKGQRWLCERVLERVANEELVVIDGLRFPEDHAFFVERFGSEFVHLHIKASDELRAARYVDSDKDSPSFDIADQQPLEAKIEELEGLAAVILQNDIAVAQLRNKVLNSVRKLCQGRKLECLSRLL